MVEGLELGAALGVKTAWEEGGEGSAAGTAAEEMA